MFCVKARHSVPTGGGTRIIINIYETNLWVLLRQRVHHHHNCGFGNDLYTSMRYGVDCGTRMPSFLLPG